MMCKFLLVDGPSQATEAQTFVALCLAELDARVACIGDQMHLPPTVVNPIGGVRKATNQLVRTAYRETWHSSLLPAHAIPHASDNVAVAGPYGSSVLIRAGHR